MGHGLSRGMLWLVPALVGLALSAALTGVPSGSDQAPSVVELSDCFSSDHGRPTLTSLSVSPEVLDVRNRDGQVTVRATASDTGGPGDPTGIRYIDVRLDAPKVDGRDPQYLYAHLNPDPAGGWTGVVIIERGWTPGRWTVTRADLKDAARPWSNASEYFGEQLTAVARTQQVTVLSATDGRVPMLTNLELSPTSLDTRRSATSVNTRVSLRDVGSGVRSAWVSAEHMRSNRYVLTKLHLTAGGARRGIWSGELPIRRWNVDGRWAIDVTAWDRSGQRRTWGPGRLRRLGFPSALRVVSATDDRRPAASAFMTDPSAVDLRTDDQQVTVRLRATDAQSGVRRTKVMLISPSRQSSVSRRLHKVSGSARDGVWAAAVPIQRCRSEAGTWTAYVDVTDQAGRDRSYEKPSSLNLAVEAEDHVTPRISEISQRPQLAGPFVVTFSEDVRGITSETMPVRRRTYPPSTPWGGTWTCLDATEAATDCAIGAVRTARFVPSKPFKPLSYEVEINPIHTLGVTDLAGNPHMWEHVEEFRPG